jgi:hypothetical protein
MPLIVGGLLALAMTWVVAKNDQAHRDAFQKEQQLMQHQHDQTHSPHDVPSGQKTPSG